MNKISFFLARRFLLASAYEQTISIMSYICFIGIIVGTFSLSLVTAIMHGFEVTIHEKMQGIHAQAIIQSYENGLDIPAIEKVIATEFPSVMNISPFATEHAIMQSSDEDIPPSVIVLKGIDPEREAVVSAIEKKITSSTLLMQAVQNNHILIGKGIAKNLGLSVGDTISLFYLDPIASKKKATIHEESALIGGIFSTGIDEFDNGLVYCSLPFLKKMFPSSMINKIGLRLDPSTDDQKLLQDLQNRLGLDVFSWKDLYPALVSALKLEKIAMFFILILITLVASMNIISLLYMLITQKRGDIAILLAMGTPQSIITQTFLFIGISLAAISSSIGLALSVIATYILEHYPFIELPDAYYVSHLPARLEWYIIGIVFLTVMALSLLATWLPVSKIKKISIADVLRHEG